MRQACRKPSTIWVNAEELDSRETVCMKVGKRIYGQDSSEASSKEGQGSTSDCRAVEVERGKKKE